MRVKLIIFILSCVMMACSSTEDVLSGFSLSSNDVAVEVGATTQIKVIGAGIYTVSVEDADVVDAVKLDDVITINGKKEGHTNVNVKNKNEMQTCAVTVIAKEDNEDYSEILNDDTPRIVGAGVNLRYGEIGVMSYGNGNAHAMVDIDTDSIASYTMGDTWTVAVNGVQLVVANAKLAKSTETRLWYRIVTESGDCVWIVACR